MLVMLSAALAFDATSDLLMGSTPQTSVSLRQAEGPWYSGTRYHFTRLTAELAPRRAWLVEPGLKVRGSMYAVGVPSEDAFLLSPGNPGLELWLTLRPFEDAQLAVFAGVMPVYLGDFSVLSGTREWLYPPGTYLRPAGRPTTLVSATLDVGAGGGARLSLALFRVVEVVPLLRPDVD